MGKYALAQSLGPYSAGTVVEVLNWKGVREKPDPRSKTVVPGYVTVRTVSPIQGDRHVFDVEWPQGLRRLRNRTGVVAHDDD